MTDLPRPAHAGPAVSGDPAGCAVLPARTGLDVPPTQMWIRAGTLLASGQRLAMIAAHRDGATVGGPWLRVVYVFTSGPPAHVTELHVRIQPGRPFIPTLAGLSASAALFEADITRQHGVVFCDPPPHGPLPAGLATAVARRRRVPASRHGDLDGHRHDPVVLAARISTGTDTPVGHTLAYAMAVEDALGRPVTTEVTRRRAVLLELERMHSHLTDLGTLVQLTGHHPLHARALHLRERLLRLNHLACGHRLLRGSVTLGGAVLREGLDPAALDALAGYLAEFTADALDNARLRARLNGVAILSTARARDLGALGFIARASGVDNDARRTHPFTRYGASGPVPVNDEGDALARFCVRAQELLTSAALVTDFADPTTAAPDTNWPVSSTPTAATCGVGIVEGWRGTIVSRVELDPRGALTRLVTVDPSYLNGAVAAAVRDTVAGADVTLARRSLHTLTDGLDL
ncbi:NADH-quinone oxidoreductase subunit D-related protein [Longispora urticae]